jgi:DNA-directed RNA polymerase II subunit RPB9
MLYPAEDRENSQLVFSCRTCHYAEEPSSACVYRNDLANTVGDTAGITQDVGQDPTVCSPFLELCTVCGTEITCEKCGKPTTAGCWLEINESDAETVPIEYELDPDYVSDPCSEDEYELAQIEEFFTGRPATKGNSNTKDQEIQHPAPQQRSQRT